MRSYPRCRRHPQGGPLLEKTQTPRKAPTDEALAVEVAAGTPSAFVHLVERHAASILAVLERGCGDHHFARDLAQEVWIKVHRGLAGFDATRRFRPWLFAIALNHLRDAQRSSGRRKDHLRVEPLGAELPDSGRDQVESREQRARIEAALDRVPEPYRSSVHLVDVLGLSYDDAATSLDCSRGTVKSRVHRGRLAFQEAYLGGDRHELRRESR